MILFQHPGKCSITMCLSQSILRVCQCKLLLRPFGIPNFPPTYAKCHFALSSSQLCKIPLRSNLASFCVLFPVWRPPSASGKRFCFEMEVKEGRAHFENRINKTWSWSPKSDSFEERLWILEQVWAALDLHKRHLYILSYSISPSQLKQSYPGNGP